jgi:pyridoxal phosphate enzyme (YggS family)
VWWDSTSKGNNEAMGDLKKNLENVKARIQKAAQACHRDPASIRLVAVSKTIPAEVVKEAIEAGATILGENYVQEARDKIKSLSSFPVHWHFIGHLQTNKAKYAVRLFDLIHSVDSLKLAQELNKEAQKSGKVQKILIQVNVAGEDTKSGVSAAEAPVLLDEIGGLENLAVNGLMTMPPYFYQPEMVRPFFAALRDLRDRLGSKALPAAGLTELSMGMTGDFEVAIQEGATLVRIGTAIFGERK